MNNTTAVTSATVIEKSVFAFTRQILAALLLAHLMGGVTLTKALEVVSCGHVPELLAAGRGGDHG
ncbi:hypothetical protein [Actinacidiphila yanglinensis]|uniref:hypothetical protein n=1 Tax=Actinacidiphila yanglinensis TaxID=310779 RepID=UPI0011B0675B|nr:hypothetical protein [Actinacidiphila yanglinensis]